jgi:hypothetical protein
MTDVNWRQLTARLCVVILCQRRPSQSRDGSLTISMTGVNWRQLTACHLCVVLCHQRRHSELRTEKADREAAEKKWERSV